MTLNLTPIIPGTLTLTGTASGSIAIGPVFTVTDGSTDVAQPGTLKFSGATVTESPAGTALVTVSGGSQAVDVGAVGPVFCGGYRGIAGALTDDASGYSDAILSNDLGATDDADLFSFWFLPTPVTVAHFLWRVYDHVALGAGDGGGHFRLAVYKADAQGQPSDLVWASSEQDGSVETLQTGTGVALDAGLYLVGVCADSDALTGLTALTTLYGPHGRVSLPDLGAIDATLDVNANDGTPVCVSRARAYGAFPDPGDPWDTVVRDSINLSSGGTWPFVPLFATFA